MAFDFDVMIKGQAVGYFLKKDKSLEILTFEKFIEPWNVVAYTPEEVYHNLEGTLHSMIRDMDHVAKSGEPINDYYLKSSFRIMTILRTMRIINDTYLKSS